MKSIALRHVAEGFQHGIEPAVAAHVAKHDETIRRRRRVDDAVIGGGWKRARQGGEDYRPLLYRFSIFESFLRVDQHGQAVFESERRERVLLSHEVDVQGAGVYEFCRCAQTLVSIVTLHLREVPGNVAPLRAIQT